MMKASFCLRSALVMAPRSRRHFLCAGSLVHLHPLVLPSLRKPSSCQFIRSLSRCNDGSVAAALTFKRYNFWGSADVGCSFEAEDFVRIAEWLQPGSLPKSNWETKIYVKKTGCPKTAVLSIKPGADMATVEIHLSGKMSFKGASSGEMAHQAIKLVGNEIKSKGGFNAGGWSSTFRLCSFHATASTGGALNLRKLLDYLKDQEGSLDLKCSPPIMLTYRHPKMTLNIWATGTINFRGVKHSEDDVRAVLAMIQPSLMEATLRVSG